MFRPIPQNTATTDVNLTPSLTETEQQSSMILATSLRESIDEATSDAQNKRPRLDEPDEPPKFEKPHTGQDLKPWDPTFYGLLHAHDYPDADPDADLLGDAELPLKRGSVQNRSDA